MNLTDDEVLKLQKGNSPIFIDDVCAVYSPFLTDIVDLGYNKFQEYLSVLTATKPPAKQQDQELDKLLDELSDFQFVLFMASIDMQTNQQFKDGFRFFTHEDITISFDPAMIYVGPIEDGRVMNEVQFYDFQQLLRRLSFLELEGEEIIIYPDDLPATKRLKLKMRENREKVRRAKMKKDSQGKGSDMKLSDLIGSMTINDCGLNMENVWNITYYAFHDQLKRMGWRDQFNINQKAALAGAKINKSQLKHWMRSIANSDK